MDVATFQNGHAPGSAVEVVATLSEAGIPVAPQAVVTVHVTMPDGGEHHVPLVLDEPGSYCGTIPLPQLGHYPLLVRASGDSFRGDPFTREELRSAATWADRTPTIPTAPGDDPRRWCELILCLLQDDRAGRALEERGVSVEGVRDCVKRFCARRA